MWTWRRPVALSKEGWVPTQSWSAKQRFRKNGWGQKYVKVNHALQNENLPCSSGVQTRTDPDPKQKTLEHHRPKKKLFFQKIFSATHQIGFMANYFPSAALGGSCGRQPREAQEAQKGPKKKAQKSIAQRCCSASCNSYEMCRCFSWDVKRSHDKRCTWLLWRSN